MTVTDARLKELVRVHRTDHYICPVGECDECDTVRALRHYRTARAELERLRVCAQALEYLACSCFLEHRESGEHNKNICIRCAALNQLREQGK